MRKSFTFIWFLALLFFFIPLFILSSPAEALCDGGLTGPKIAGNVDGGWLRAIRQEYDKANPGCQGQEIPVTILLQKGAITGHSHTLATMRSLNLKPIIRLASSGSSTGWARISPTEARQMAADVSQIISQAGITNPIVYFGNEPNLPAEWGGTADPISFAQSFGAFIQAAGSNRNFQVFLPPVATHQAGVEFNFMTQVLNYPLATGTIGQLIDGAALTIYHDSPASINNLYQQLRNFYGGWGITNFFVSEVGPLIDGQLLQEFCQLQEWKDFMSNFFQNQPITGVQGINTSFFADLDCDGDPDYTFLVVIDSQGQVEIYLPLDAEGTVVTIEDDLRYKNREQELTECCAVVREGATTISGASLVCADFTTGSSTTTETGGTPTPTPESDVLAVTSSISQISGRLRLEEIKFPDFDRFQQSMVNGLIRLLPGELGQKMSLPGDIKIPLTHFVQGRGESGGWANTSSRGNSPASDAKVPANLWGRLAGATRGLCGFLGVGICSPVSNFQFQLAEAGSAEIGACPAGQPVKPADLPTPTTRRADFSIAGLIETIVDIIGDLTRTTIRREIQVRSRGQLPGGQETGQNSEWMEGMLPGDINQTIAGNNPLSEEFRYRTTLGSEEINSQAGQYDQLGKMQSLYCLDLCGRLPSGIDVSSVDPLCPSCNPESYKPIVSLEDVPLDTSWCHADASGACNYYKCKIGVDPGCEASQGCGPDQAPICESNYCNPLEWRQAKDYLNQGCSVPYDAPDCFSVCAKQTFAENKEEGGYGYCRYTNATVCVRQDRVATGNCAALCNWACCQ